MTFAGVVKDAQGKPILYDRELTQAVCSGLARKAAWQAEQFRALGKAPIIFLDEPFLTGFGSAYLPISKDEVTEILTHTLEDREAAAGPVTLGMHCCGNTDWSLLLNVPIDILSFDSYGYFESLRLYGQALAHYLARAAGWPGVWSPPTRTSGRRPRTSCGSVSRPRQPGWLKTCIGASRTSWPSPSSLRPRHGLH